MAKKKRSDSNWLLIYVMCPIVASLSIAAIIYTFKELPKISVLKDSFDRQNEQVQKKLEFQDEQIQKVKDAIVLLAEKTDKLDAELVGPLTSKVNDLNNNIKKSESRYLAEIKEYSEKVATKISAEIQYGGKAGVEIVQQSEFEKLKKGFEKLKKEIKKLKKEIKKLK